MRRLTQSPPDRGGAEGVLGSAEQAHREILRLMQAGDWRTADATCERLTVQYPNFAGGWFAASRIAMALRSPASALAAIDRALAVEPFNVGFLTHRAQCLLALNRRQDALNMTDAVERCAPIDPAIWDAIGMVRTGANEHRGALAVYERAATLAPQEPHFIYNRAAARRFLGDLEGAEADYDRVIALRPLDYEAYMNRSELRVQTSVRNHVKEMEALAAGNIINWQGEVQIRFALAKEYEDLGEYAKSFEQLQRGAKTRRKHMKYDIAIDTSTVDWIISAFPSVPTEAVGTTSEDAPIFIIGLPRSGTTLVKRILGSHSLVSSAGELDCFASAVIDAVRQKSGQAQMPRQQLVGLSATLDFAALGREYLRRARSVFSGNGRFIDKMPLNYLYCGLIRQALPHAKIIHVTRHPMAVGYAMYKTLFKNGYPFSYDLSAIGQYYVAYRRLMQHWEAIIPGVMHHVSYEDLVANHRVETRKLLDYCDLNWEEACVAFNQNPEASTTASASQVRRPIYNSSVSQWRHYEQQLRN
jgi:tetratricopeptide (TPR) repeat protein